MHRATLEQVALAARKLLAGGESVTVRSVREITSGSYTTISNYLKVPGVREGAFEVSDEAVEVALKVSRQKKITDAMFKSISGAQPSAFHTAPRVDHVVDDELFALTERFRRLQEDYDGLISEANRVLAAARDRVKIYARKVEWLEMERTRLLTENKQIREALDYFRREGVTADRESDE